VWLFREGKKELRDLLGGKGANLAEMTNIGLPVPPDLPLPPKSVLNITPTASRSPPA
jgi:pyruvate,orthophosphate dikinase